ncbi:MAG: three-Cys-motif partner protein TcmP [Acidimicrobiales bacterium]
MGRDSCDQIHPGVVVARRGWGYWTEAKLDVLSAYLPAFATASKFRAQGALVYLDLFAGNGANERRDVERDIRGSAIRALESLPHHATVVLFERDRVAAQLEAELRTRFPGRSFEVVPGDSNTTLPRALDRLRELGVDWAPSFAFVDPYSSASLRWDTIARLAAFKSARKYKVEQWLLFYGSDIPRLLGQSPSNAELLSQTFGGNYWVPIANARQDGELSAEEARDHYTNLLRWRLESALGYKFTHSFEVKNTSGAYLYDLVFATDNVAGNQIMGDVYVAAARRFEAMRREAFERRRNLRPGQEGLFDPATIGELTTGDVPPYQAAPPVLPFGFTSDDQVDQ